MSNKKFDPKEPVSTGVNDTLLKFPTLFPIKAMGKMRDASNTNNGAGFGQIVLDIVLKHAPDFDGKTIEMRPSKNGNYLSVTATINAQSKLQIDNIYRELSAHPAVLKAL